MPWLGMPGCQLAGHMFWWLARPPSSADVAATFALWDAETHSALHTLRAECQPGRDTEYGYAT